jgi:DNA polymerase-1
MTWVDMKEAGKCYISYGFKKNRQRYLSSIDANAIVHRAFHAYPPSLKTEDGLQVNAVYGFTVMLLKALEMFHPEYVLCAFDTAKPTFRHTKFTDYKATRKPTDKSLIEQFPLVEDILKAFNIPILKVEGFEADDILGTISKYVSNGKWRDYNLDMYILSGDRDLLQLVDENVRVCLPEGNFKNIRVYDRIETFKKYGYYPEQVIDYKAVVGDASDNIPGVKGVGEKTVLELLEKYKTLDKIYGSLNDLKPRIANLLAEGIEQAEFSRDLATIDRNVDISVQLNDCLLRDFNKDELLSVFKRFAFKSLVSKIDLLFGNDKSISDSSQLGMFGEISSLDSIEYSDPEEFQKALDDGKKMYLAYFKKEESLENVPFLLAKIWGKDGDIQEFVLKQTDFEVPLLEEIVTYNWEEMVAENRVKVKKGIQVIDICLLGHLIKSNASGYSFKDLSFSYATKIFKEKISPSQKDEIFESLEEIAEKERKEADGLEHYNFVKENIWKYFKVERSEQETILKELEVPVSLCLGEIERRGILLDVNELRSLNKEMDEEISYVKKEMFDCIGHEVNINSPKQLSDLLFEELQLPYRGKRSTRESVLYSLVGIHLQLTYIE